MEPPKNLLLNKTALICGVTGQDGAYLAATLLEKGYVVYGSTRKLPLPPDNNLARLGIEEKIRLLQLDPTKLEIVRNTLTIANPSEIYNLGGQTSVSASFKSPLETWESIEIPTINWLEALRLDAPEVRFFNAGSGECFGNVSGKITEQTAMTPISPYGTAKAGAYRLVSTYRNVYNLHASTGILFNHESPLRDKRFVTRKIIDGARSIANGTQTQLHLGNLNIWRDWGWAPDYVEAIWRMLQSDQADDYIISTGKSASLQYFIKLVFEHFDLNWEAHIVSDKSLLRLADISKTDTDPSKIKKNLGWQATHHIDKIVKMLVSDYSTKQSATLIK